MMREQVKNGIPGIPVLLLLLLAMAVTAIAFVRGAGQAEEVPSAAAMMMGAFLLGIFELILLRGLFVVAPNQARVLQLFGSYAGTA